MGNSIARMRELATELRDADATIADLEDRLREHKERVRQITTGELVDLMQQMDVSRFDIEASGNLPPFTFELDNHFNASIPQSWEEERRENAFALLPDELIKITVKALFAKGEAKMAMDLAEELVVAGYTVSVEKTVHHSTLKAWVREQFETDQQLPDLETIGASIFNEVKVKEKKQ
jgi:hypothetical protein